MHCRALAASSLGFGLAILSSGCDGGGGGSPTAPLAPASATSAITVASIAPANGATLHLDPCPDVDPIALCTDDLVVTFSVLPERDLAQARMHVAFYEGGLRGRQCAWAATEFRDLTAGARVSMTVSRVEMIVAGDGAAENRRLACDLPATTGLMIATLVQNPDQRSHSADFDYLYTFARP